MSARLIPSPPKDGFVLSMAAVCIAGFGGFIGWAALAPLEEGVAASGAIVTETNRQVVQHLEGGIIDTIAVREGAMVEAGEVLVTLKDTASLAQRDQIIQELAAFRATVERLQALQSERDTPDFTVLDALTLGEVERRDIIDRERQLFTQQRQALEADVQVLLARRDASLTTERLRADQIEIAQRSLSAAREELALRQEMLAEQLARRDQVTTLERSVAELEGDIARLTSEREEAGARARDLDGQIVSARATFAQEVASELRDARASLLSAEERLNAAQDILDRSVITAPVSGEVLNMRFATETGVVKPGEPILEIVPPVATMTASVRIRPVDRASVYEGQPVRTRILAYRSWRAPRLQGEVIGVSADLKTDPNTGGVYYEARVQVPADEVGAAHDMDVRPGMPVEVFIFSGVSRTTLDYLFEPLGESLFRGFRSS